MRNSEFNIAASRLIYELIGADGYVSDRELMIMDAILSKKYKFDDPSRAVEINGITFSKALTTIRSWYFKEDVNKLMDELKLIAGVGKVDYNDKIPKLKGFCSLNEAWILLAIEYAIDNDDVKIFSFDKKEYRFSKSEIIYLENNNSNSKIYNELNFFYSEYKAKLALCGLDLVYIPKVCDYFKMKREERKLKLLMRYVNSFHKHDDADAQKIIDNIDSFTTQKFTEELLFKNQDIYNELQPSLLLKIGTSTIIRNNKSHSCNDFLLIPIKESVGKTIESLIKTFRGYTNDTRLPKKRDNGNSFKLHGFDRTFLNFVMTNVLSTEIITKILFDFSYDNKNVVFVFNDQKTTKISLGNKQMCLYLLIIIFTIYKKGVPLKRKFKIKNSFKTDVEKVFLSIYGKVRANSHCELYSQSGDLATDLNRLDNKMKAVPKEYHAFKNENKLIAKFPCKDIVFVKFDRKEFLFNELFELKKSENGLINIENVCETIFK